MSFRELPVDEAWNQVVNRQLEISRLHHYSIPPGRETRAYYAPFSIYLTLYCLRTVAISLPDNHPFACLKGGCRCRISQHISLQAVHPQCDQDSAQPGLQFRDFLARVFDATGKGFAIPGQGLLQLHGSGFAGFVHFR